MVLPCSRWACAQAHDSELRLLQIDDGPCDELSPEAAGIGRLRTKVRVGGVCGHAATGTQTSRRSPRRVLSSRLCPERTAELAIQRSTAIRRFAPAADRSL